MRHFYLLTFKKCGHSRLCVPFSKPFEIKRPPRFLYIPPHVTGFVFLLYNISAEHEVRHVRSVAAIACKNASANSFRLNGEHVSHLSNFCKKKSTKDQQ